MAPEPLNRLVRATVVSLIGLRDVYRSEAAFRQELLVLLLVIPAAWLLTSAWNALCSLEAGCWLLWSRWLTRPLKPRSIALAMNVMSFRGKQRFRFGSSLLLDCAFGGCLDIGLGFRVAQLKKDNPDAQEDTANRDRHFRLYVVPWLFSFHSGREPLELVRTAVDKAIQILKDPKLQSQDKKRSASIA